MKSCPFCAEEIRDEAIKCRFCGSFLPAEGAGGEAPAGDKPADKVIVAGEIGAPAGGNGPTASGPSAGPPGEAGAERRDKPDPGPREHDVIYEGAPLWRAYFRAYLLAALAVLGLPILGYLASSAWASDPAMPAVAVGVPLAAGAIAFAAVHGKRRSKRIRITSHNIEREYGILSKRIDVLELWRCRDVRYRQSFSDRLLRIAHLELYTSDIASPHFVIEGMPSSRELFQRIRDAIERERHHNRDYHRYTS